MIDWQTNSASRLESETYKQLTEYDALNRMTRLYNWHLPEERRIAIYLPRYNKRGALASEDLVIHATGYDPDTGTLTTAIQEIRYNAKGQKEYLELGNRTITRYDYDKKTFRLSQLRTTRPRQDPPFPGTHSNLLNPNILQQLNYTYDPVGNITEISDEAYKPVYFANGIAEPRNLYEYDALYRLTWTQGRETAQGGDAARDGDEPAIANGFPITDQTLRRYTQSYEYDNVGNFVAMRHGVPTDTAKGWTRAYACATDSNRLLSTEQASNVTRYGYDTHGSMLNLASVPDEYRLQWDHRDMIKRINLGGGGTANYQYDSGKQRTRKRIDSQNGTGYWERIYLGGYERYRRYNGNGSTLVEEIESHHLFEGEQRVLLVDDVIKTNRKHANNIAYKEEPIYRYQYSNHLGSACLELDDAAEIISYEEYHPYGTSAYRLMKSGIESPAKRYRYTGMERDEESGLGYHTARYYMLWLGRWGSCDPIGILDANNLYLYGNDNPSVLLDPQGTCTEEFCLPHSAKDVTLESTYEPGVTKMSYKDFELMTEEERKSWYETKLSPYEAELNDAALRHNIPSQLIATVILNELADIRFEDVLQESLPISKGSVGIAQIQIATAIEFDLVDISEAEIADYQRKSTVSGKLGREGYEDEFTASRDSAIRSITREKLKSPEVAIEAAARRIKQLLHTAFSAQNDFSSELLLAYRQTASIYDAIDAGGSTNIRDKERRLANLVTAAYNSPDILIAQNPGDPFVVEEKGPYFNGRTHGINSRTISDELSKFGLFHGVPNGLVPEIPFKPVTPIRPLILRPLQ